MILLGRGQPAEGFYALGSDQTPVYLLDGEKPVLFDGGFAHWAPAYIRAIKETLGGRKPHYLLHTHMHFDHCGATSAIKKAFPEVVIGASSIGADIIARPNALELIIKLSDEAREVAEGFVSEDPELETFSPFEVELKLKDGDVLDLGGGQTLNVYSTPGHTRDFLSYFNPQRKVLIASESVGCANTSGVIGVEFVYDYDAYLASLEFLVSLKPKVLCQGHIYVYTGEDVTKYLEATLEATKSYRKTVERLLSEENGDIEAVLWRVKEAHWDKLTEPKQPEGAYILNTRARVKNLASKMGFTAT